jgi:Skp family chaperone for outer membrane proteins
VGGLFSFSMPWLLRRCLPAYSRRRYHTRTRASLGKDFEKVEKSYKGEDKVIEEKQKELKEKKEQLAKKAKEEAKKRAEAEAKVRMHTQPSTHLPEYRWFV